MNLKYFLLLLQAATLFGNPYLKAPQLVLQQDIEHSIAQNALLDLDFTWRFSGTNFHCLCDGGKAAFAITSLALPIEYKDQFECMRQDGVTMFVYTRGEIKHALKVPNLYPQPPLDYHIVKPRKFKTLCEPKSITADQLADYVKHHAVVFYTGAGLSIASGVPAMDRVEAAFHIERDNNDLNIGNIIVHGAEILENIRKFCEQGKNAQPSSGHKAIAQLAQKKNCVVFTENIDILHQKSGIDPLVVSADLKNDAQYFTEIDAIICIGLSHDDRGLLAFYKENNTTGLIIAIDLKQPDYLGDEDALVIGDLQELLPILAENLDN